MSFEVLLNLRSSTIWKAAHICIHEKSCWFHKVENISVHFAESFSNTIHAVSWDASQTTVPRSCYVPDQGVCLGWISLQGLDQITDWLSVALHWHPSGQWGGGSLSPTPTRPTKGAFYYCIPAQPVMSYAGLPIFCFTMVFLFDQCEWWRPSLCLCTIYHDACFCNNNWKHIELFEVFMQSYSFLVY